MCRGGRMFLHRYPQHQRLSPFRKTGRESHHPRPVFTNFEGELIMSALTIRLPNSVHESIKLLARKDGISVNQFIASAASEKMASFQTLDYLRREAALGKREDFEQFLKLVPDVPAQAGDELSSDIDTLVKTKNKKP